MKTLTKFKIPTLLGIGIIFIGIAVGVFLVLREQTYFTSAAQSTKPEIIYEVSNIEDSNVVISWKTSVPSLGFVTYGINDAGEQTELDDRDSVPRMHLMHYVTLKNLLPKTTYKYRIVSGNIKSEIRQFPTASPSTNQTKFNPVIGSVLDHRKAVDEGIAFLSISGVIQSSLVKNSGNFLIPLINVKKEDLSEAKIKVISPNGEASVVFLLKEDGVSLPLINIGDNLDLTITPTPSPTPTPDLTIYDLNKDKKINAADYSLAQKNKGKEINGVLINDQYLKQLSNMITNQTSGQ